MVLPVGLRMVLPVGLRMAAPGGNTRELGVFRLGAALRVLGRTSLGSALHQG